MHHLLVKDRFLSKNRVNIRHEVFIMVEYVNIPIPKPLYERLVKTLEGSGYRSATEYIIFLIRKVLPDLESNNMEQRLRALGYIQ